MAFVSQKCVFSIAREISKDSNSRVERENETSTLVLLYTEEEKQYFHYLSIKITLMKLFFPLSWISQIYNDDDLKTQKVDLLRWNIILITWKQLNINFKNSSWFGVFLFWIYYRFMACFIFSISSSTFAASFCKRSPEKETDTCLMSLLNDVIINWNREAKFWWRHAWKVW